MTRASWWQTAARLRPDDRGSALTEMALILPVVAVLLMGALDAGHTMFMNATLQGAVQKAARDSSIENGMDATNQAAIDAKVRQQVRSLANTANVTFTRKAYKSFSSATQTLERYTDTNGNGSCDNNEPFIDENNNNFRDGGFVAGSGGTKDSVVYTVNVTYPHVFPVIRLMGPFAQVVGFKTNVALQASTVLNNQPFGDQAAASIGNCP